MSPEKSRFRPRRSSIEAEEERVWIGFYRRTERDPSIATEILSQLEANPEMKHKHSALYLCCKDTLRQQKTRQARNQRIGQFICNLIHSLFVVPWKELRRRLRDGSDIAVEYPAGNRERTGCGPRFAACPPKLRQPANERLLSSRAICPARRRRCTPFWIA